MLPLGPPDIKFSVETQKSPFGDIGNLTKLTHDPLPPYHRASGGFGPQNWLFPLSPLNMSFTVMKGSVLSLRKIVPQF